MSVGGSIIEHMSESMVLLQRAVDSARGSPARPRSVWTRSGVRERRIRDDGGRHRSVGARRDGAATIDIAAALRISRGVADWQVRYAHAMHHRLPLLAARFRAGEITEDASAPPHSAPA